jgi:hypothetical protein
VLNPFVCYSPPQVWPMLVDYFYRDSITIAEDNVCALLALSRQLLVVPVCQYCSDFVAQHLTTGNCIAYLRQAERYQLHDIQQQAVALAAQGEACRWQKCGAAAWGGPPAVLPIGLSQILLQQGAARHVGRF